MNETQISENTYTLDIPQREGKEGFIGTYFTLCLQIGKLLSSGDFSQTDFRLLYLTHFLISLIPGKKDREAIRTEFVEAVKTETQKISTNEERGHLTNLVCIRYAGCVMDFIDKHVGVSRENKIGFSMVRK